MMPAFLSQHQRIRVPTVPQREAGFQHLVGAVVALLARRELVQAGVLRLEIGGRGDDVPGHAAPLMASSEPSQRAR